LVVEAIIESLKVKRDLFGYLDTVAKSVVMAATAPAARADAQGELHLCHQHVVALGHRDCRGVPRRAAKAVSQRCFDRTYTL
jgi:hypothetical protein